MNQLWNLVKKECRELLTPSSLASVIAVCVILIVLGSVVGGQINKSTVDQPVGIIDETAIDYEYDSDTYSSAAIKQLESYYEKKYPSSPVSDYVIKTSIQDLNDDAVLKFMRDKKVDTCILIPKGFNENMEKYLDGQGTQPYFTIYYNQQNTSAFSAISTATGTLAYSQMNLGMTYKIMDDKHISKEEAIKWLAPSAYTNTTFFNGKVLAGTSPAQITSALSTQTMFVPIIMMLIIVMIGSILISSMGNEKENKTLETLLTLPISRTKVVAGKLLGCAIAGLVMGAIYMIGMYFYLHSFSSAISGGKSLQELGLALNGLDWIIVAVFVFLSIMCALGMCMILGAFAKNYKAAQTYVMPISVLAVIPMFVTMFSSFTQLPIVLQGLLFIIPFTHPMMVLQNIMFGNWALIIAGGIYLVIFAVAMIYITVRLYNSDILLTGWLRKSEKKGKMSWSDLFNKNKN